MKTVHTAVSARGGPIPYSDRRIPDERGHFAWDGSASAAFLCVDGNSAAAYLPPEVTFLRTTD